MMPQLAGVRPRGAAAALVGLGLLSTALYGLGIAWVYPLATERIPPRTTWPPLVGYTLRAGLRHALVYGLLIGLYLVALRVASRLDPQRPRRALAIIVGGWLAMATVLLAAYPGESLDVFDYLFRGRMLVLHGASPLAITPDALRDERFYAYLSWHNVVDTYGPLWEYASGLTSALVGATGRESLASYIVGYRLLALVLSGLCGALIAAIVGRQAGGAAALAALLTWLWNPLLLISTALGAHNDVLMLCFVLLAVLLVARQRWLLALLALGLAAHVKLTALLLLPVLGVWLIRRRGWWRALGTSALALVIGLPLSWLLYAPLGGWATLPRMLRERTALIYNSPANIVYHLLQRQASWPEPQARQAVTLGSTLLFALLAAPLLWRLWRATPQAALAADERLLWRSGSALTLAYLIVGSFWFQSWYVLWVLALAALLPGSRLTRTLLPLYCLGALWSNLATDFLNQDPARRFDSQTIGQIMVAVLLAPLLCGLAGAWLWQRRQQRPALRQQRSVRRDRLRGWAHTSRRTGADHAHDRCDHPRAE